MPPSAILLPILVFLAYHTPFAGAASDNTTVCAQFTTTAHSPSPSFTSPLFPSPYPSTTTCTRLLEAPPGHVIRLHFLDIFDIESTKDPEADPLACPYDYLEVRDGQFGYSRLIRKFCGSVAPAIVESSSRWLWLRFKSDGSIEGEGFRIGIEWVERGGGEGEVDEEIPTCGDVLFVDPATEFHGILNSTASITPEVLEAAQSTTIAVDCTWIIEVPADTRIYLQFKHYELHRPNDCEHNFVEIYGAVTELEGDEGQLRHFCGSDKEFVTSPSNKIHLRFYSALDWEEGGKGEVKGKVIAEWSIFRPIEGEDKCAKMTEFDCTDNTCIPASLTCDGTGHCKGRNDEDANLCGATNTFQLKTNILIIAFLGILLMSGMCSGLVLNVVRKLREERAERLSIKKSQSSSLTSGQPPGGAPPQPLKTAKSSSSTPSEVSRGTVVMASGRQGPPGPGKFFPRRSSRDEVVMEMRDTACQTPDFYDRGSGSTSNAKRGTGADVIVWK